MTNPIEITVTTPQMLPGYGDDSQVGPLEGKILAAITATTYRGRIDHWNRNTPQALQVLGANTVSIIDTQTNTILWRKSTNGTTTANVKSALDELANTTYNSLTGEYTLPNGSKVDPIIPGTEPDSTSLLPSLFNLNINLPPLIWWGIAAGALYTASRSRNKLGQYGGGAVAVIAAGNAIKR